MDLRPPMTRKEVFSSYYCPIEAGYKDRSGVLPYDKAVCRALESTYRKPKDVTGSEDRTLFVGRLPPEAEEGDLEKAFSRYGEVEETRVTRDLVTGAPRGYGFVVFARRRDAAAARVGCRRLCLAGADVVVEAEFSRGLRGWRPRRLGGGLGGKKESGQLRFGGAARPFQVPVSEPTEPDRSRPRWTSDRVTDGGERVPDPAGGPGRHSGESAPSQRRGEEERHRTEDAGRSERDETRHRHRDRDRHREQSRDRHRDRRRESGEDRHRSHRKDRRGEDVDRHREYGSDGHGDRHGRGERSGDRHRRGDRAVEDGGEQRRSQTRYHRER